uniref:Integrase core domain containing protein n=1 Tax=Solanum tuberosum TaxID=4113 RepID=M1DED8_SOLTU
MAGKGQNQGINEDSIGKGNGNFVGFQPQGVVGVLIHVQDNPLFDNAERVKNQPTPNNLKSDIYCMSVTTRGGKQTIDPPMPTRVKSTSEPVEEEVEVLEEPKDQNDKEAKVDEGTIPAPTKEPDMNALSSTSSGLAASTPRSHTPIGFAMLPLARVQKFETQMATLLQHITPWMRKSVKESKAQAEKAVEVKIQVVHQMIDAFQLQMLERPQPGPTIGITAFQMELAKLQDNIYVLAVIDIVVLEI